MRRRRRCLGAIALWLVAGTAFGWTYPEHRDIALAAVGQLDGADRAAFTGLWQATRHGAEARLCALGADVQQGLTPECIDWAALLAISGDHACSGVDLRDTVLRSDWILTVADIAAQLKQDLARSDAGVAVARAQRPDTADVDDETPRVVSEARRRLADEKLRAQRLNAVRTADIRLQRADARYATRAGAGLAHFMRPRPDTRLDPSAYARLSMQPGSELNALGVYGWYHQKALQAAARLAAGDLSDAEHGALARAILFNEAFALHFLQDTFAAGHVAGSWGDVSQRKGTHDYYNRSGLEVYTWRNRDETHVLMGDAYMGPEDLERTAEAVRISLAQVIGVAMGQTPAAAEVLNAGGGAADSTAPDDFNVCERRVFPPLDQAQAPASSRVAAVPLSVLIGTPVPGLSEGLGSQPRARSEVGAFLGLASSVEVRGIRGGFGRSQDEHGAIAGLDLGLRIGLGMEGALNDSGDGLAFLQLGLSTDTPSSTALARGASGGNLVSAVPARSALSLRLRSPYVLVPGDLLLLSPMVFFDRERYTRLAVTASNGGLLGLQRGWDTGIGRFQFVLGREVGLKWYGYDNKNELFVPGTGAAEALSIVSFKSVGIDLPVAEYRPFRAFAGFQSSTLMFQLFVGADVPYSTKVEVPLGTPRPDLRTVWSIGVRMLLDWRHYW